MDPSALLSKYELDSALLPRSDEAECVSVSWRNERNAGFQVDGAPI